MAINDPIDSRPQFTKATLLEEESIENLPNIFPRERFKIRPEHTDVGIDLYLELRSENKEYTNARFDVQLKSREDATTNADGSYSKSIEKSNVLYLTSGDRRAMYIFYVVETKTYYYEWADVFRDQLNNMNPNWKTQETVTLKFYKQLNAQAVDEIYKETMRRSIISRQKREGVSIEAIVDSFHARNDQRNYTDIIWSLTQLIETFEGLTVLPGHILSKLPPFSLKAKSRSYFDDISYTLYSDNPALFEFFNDLGLDGENYIRKSDGVILPTESLRNIMIFLEYNFINHISPSAEREHDKRVCAHKLFYHKGCDCERCSLKKLRWGNMVAKLNVPLDEKEVNSWLRRGIVLLEMGKIREAFELYKRLASESFQSKRYVAYIVAKFHLVSSGFLIRNAFHVHDSDTMSEEVSKIDLQLEIEKIAEQAEVKSEAVKVLRWLVGSNYYLGMYVEMDLRFRDSIKARDSDRRGNIISTNHYQKLSATVSELTVFAEGNSFHITYFNGFSLVVLKVIEGGLIQYSLNNPMSAKVSDVHPYFLHLCFTYCESEKLNELLNKYKIERLCFGYDEGDPDGDLLTYVNDLLLSVEECTTFIVKEFDAGNAAPKRKFNNQLKVAMVLVSVANLKEAQLNQLLPRFLKLADSAIVEPDTVGGLREIFMRRKKVISVENYLNCYRVLLSAKAFDRILLTQELPFQLQETHPGFIDNDPETEATIRRRADELNHTNDFQIYILIFFCQVASDDSRCIIARKVEDLLSKQFDGQVFYLAAYHGVVDPNRFFNKLLEHVPRNEMTKRASRSIMGYDDFTNDNLDRVITLGYKYSIDLSRPEIRALANGVSYYEWLLDLENFDYQKFDPYWLLLDPNAVFIEEFRKHNKIRVAVREYLKTRNVSRLKDIYIEYLSEETLKTS